MSASPRPVRVCILSSSHPADYSRFLGREARSLALAGYDVTWVALRGPRRLPHPEGVRVRVVRSRRYWAKFLTLRELGRVARECRADVYHCVDPWALMIGLKLRRARPGLHLVYDSTESYPEVYLQRPKTSLALRVSAYLTVRYLEGQAARHCSGIVETNATRALRFARMGRRPTLVPNYPLISALPECFPERKRQIAYTGLISEQRGILVLLEAMCGVTARFPDVRLVIAGEFVDADTRRRYESYIADHRLGGSIELQGWLGYSDMFALLAQSCLGVILLQPGRFNDYTGLPNKLFEFMGAGVATVCSDFPEMSRVVSQSGCGWTVDPSDAAGIADVLTRALDQQNETLRRGDAGRRAVEQIYNWQHAEARLLGLYRRLVVDRSLAFPASNI